VTAGKVRVNRDKIDKSSHGLKIGDVVTVTAHSRVRILKVAAMGARRGPPAEAAMLFEDLTPPSEPRERLFEAAPAAAREAGSGRPTKRDRRDMDKFQNSGEE
jgi:ribosome-associated heat shock protein Hsp15